jgi:YD repeat-containing protein
MHYSLFLLWLLSTSVFAENYSATSTYTYYGTVDNLPHPGFSSVAAICLDDTPQAKAYYGPGTKVELARWSYGSLGGWWCQIKAPSGYVYSVVSPTLVFSCPHGGTVSGSICTNAPTCIAPQVRNIATGLCELSPTSNPIKNNGRPPCDLIASNPINIGTGNKFQLEADYQGAGDFPLIFERAYNSDASTISIVFGAGSGWRHSYERSISDAANNHNQVVAYRPEGRAFSFSLAGNWLPDTDVNLQLTAIDNGWRLVTEDGNIETYNTNGQLLSIKSRTGATQTLFYDSSGLLTSVIHSNGRSLSFTYDSSKRLTGFQDPAGGQYQYVYDIDGNLVSVTFPDQKTRSYVYNEPANVASSLPHALTGIIDENGQRYAIYRYAAQNLAISTQHAGGAGYASVSYGTQGVVVIDALGTSRTTGMQTIQGRVKSIGSNQPAGTGCSAASRSIAYDANGNIASKTDFNGNLSCYRYDLTRNLETVRVEGLSPGSSCPADLATYTPAAGSNAHKISTQWHVSYRLPIQIDLTGQRQSFSYDAIGNLLQKTVTDTTTQQSRVWTYTYNNLGQVLTEDGPRTDVADVIAYAYYSDSTATHKPGDLQSVTSALGHVTTFTGYDANGRLLSRTDPNGLVTTLTYDVRGRLLSADVSGEMTTYGYYPTGLVSRVTWPGGASLDYRYDDAHRLVEVEDQAGNMATYTLDPMGNRTQEHVRDPSGQLARTQSRVYDALSRLQHLIQTP